MRLQKAALAPAPSLVPETSIIPCLIEFLALPETALCNLHDLAMHLAEGNLFEYVLLMNICASVLLQCMASSVQSTSQPTVASRGLSCLVSGANLGCCLQETTFIAASLCLALGSLTRCLCRPCAVFSGLETPDRALSCDVEEAEPT